MAQQDSAIIERRLRPVYDAIGNKNYKKALHETEKILKKTPNLLCAQILKGSSLCQLGRLDDGNAIIQQVIDAKPCDDLTLQVLNYALKDQCKFESICEIYKNAVEKDKDNEGLLTQLFVSQTCINQFTDQQKVAMQLYKMKQKNPYYCWAVMSLVLKATQGDDKNEPIKQKISLELAQRMMEKFINDNKLESEQEAELYLIILQKQNKFAEQLTFLDSEICKKVYPGAPIEMRIELMKNIKQWPKLNVLLKSLLRDNIDRWDYYKMYVETVAVMVTDGSKEGDATDEDQLVDNTFEKCHAFLNELIELGNKKYRGPHLGRLELYRVMNEQKFDAKALLGDFMEMLLEYFRIFGEKLCCAKDLILFLDVLEAEQRPELASKLIRSCDIIATTLPRSKEQMQRHICSLQISRICGAHKLSADHLTALYTAFTLHYEHGMNAFDVDILPTEFDIPDAFALLAVHVLYDIAYKQKSSNHMVEGICLMHYLLANSPNNFHAKLLCMQLYHRLGCPYGANQMYKSLNLKFIQLHSMGYLHCAQLSTSGIPDIALDTYEATTTFFENYIHEGHEFVAMCYKFGSFSKLEEFMAFRNKLMSSFHCLSISVENMIMVIMGYTLKDVQPKMGLIIMKMFENLKNYSDDRDLSVIARWDPIDKTTEKQQNDEILRQDFAFARIRLEILRIMESGLHLENDVRPDIEQCFEQWPKIFAEIRATNPLITSSEYLADQLPSRLHLILELPYEQIIQNCIDFIKSAEHRYTEPIDNIRERFVQHIQNLGDMCCKQINENNLAEDRLWNRKQLQETVAMTTEIFAIATRLFFGIFERYISPLLSSTKKETKRSKKKTTNDTDSSFCVPNQRELFTAFSSILNQLKTSIISFDAAVESWKVPVLSKNLSEILGSLSLNPKVGTLAETYANIKENHELTIKETRDSLAYRINVLNGMIKNCALN